MLYLWGPRVSVIFLLLSILTTHSFSISNSSQSFCHSDERFALLDFKNSLTIDSLASEVCSNEDHFFDYGELGQVPKAKTKSWKWDANCCEWDGVTCHPITGHVIGLDLSCAQLKGTIGPNNTLFQLRLLKTLNLAFNIFYKTYISPQFGKFSHLTNLNLSNSAFQGIVPSEIGHLKQLTSLDLSLNQLKIPDFQVIVENLTALTRLKLDDAIISSDIPQSLINRSSLTYLSLSGCFMQGKLPSRILKLSQLQVLIVGDNLDLYTDMQLGNWSKSLEILDLTFLNITNQLPYSLVKSKPLRKLSLYGCRLYGTIPPWVWNTSEVIEFSDNYLIGSFPSKLSNLPSLVTLRLGPNYLSGSVNLNMFSESNNLRALDLSNSGLSVITTSTHELNSTLICPELSVLFLSSCNISEFPSLKAPEKLWWLDLSNNNIQGMIPKWLQGMGQLLDTNHVLRLNLSHNSLTMDLEHLPWTKLTSVDLSSNMLQGPLPNFPSNVVLQELHASNNKLNGTINPSTCYFSQVMILDLSNNTLAGEVPLCLVTITDWLVVLNLQSNRLNGTLPCLISNSSSLTLLDLSNNQLEGVVPKSISLLRSLRVLNLGNNKLGGCISHMVG